MTKKYLILSAAFISLIPLQESRALDRMINRYSSQKNSRNTPVVPYSIQEAEKSIERKNRDNQQKATNAQTGFNKAAEINHDSMVILCELYDVQTFNDPMTISLKLKSILDEYRAFHGIKVREDARGIPLYGPDILGSYIDANFQLIQEITAQPQLYDLSKISLDPINITSYCTTYSFSKLSIPKILPSS